MGRIDSIRIEKKNVPICIRGVVARECRVKSSEQLYRLINNIINLSMTAIINV